VEAGGFLSKLTGARTKARLSTAARPCKVSHKNARRRPAALTRAAARKVSAGHLAVACVVLGPGPQPARKSGISGSNEFSPDRRTHHADRRGNLEHGVHCQPVRRRLTAVDDAEIKQSAREVSPRRRRSASEGVPTGTRVRGARHDPDVARSTSARRTYHFEHTLLCLEAGSTCLIAKPFAMNARSPPDDRAGAVEDLF